MPFQKYLVTLMLRCFRFSHSLVCHFPWSSMYISFSFLSSLQYSWGEEGKVMADYLVRSVDFIMRNLDTSQLQKTEDFQFLPSRQVSCMVCFSSQGNKVFLLSRNLYNKPFILEKSRHYCQHSLYGPVLQSVFCLCSCIILSGSSGNVIAARELKEKAL